MTRVEREPGKRRRPVVRFGVGREGVSDPRHLGGVRRTRPGPRHRRFRGGHRLGPRRRISPATPAPRWRGGPELTRSAVAKGPTPSTEGRATSSSRPGPPRRLLCGAERNTFFGQIGALASKRAARHGWPPLHDAAVSGHLDVVRVLLAKGADPKQRDERGAPPCTWPQGTATTR